MAAIRFSRRAEADLLSIGDYTLRTWGKAQAARYLGELEVCCQTGIVRFSENQFATYTQRLAVYMLPVRTDCGRIAGGRRRVW